MVSPRRLSRRSFLAVTSGGLLVACRGNQWVRPPRSPRVPPPPPLPGNPFTLGLASGDPTHHSVILWTRLAPEPMAPGGAMPPEAVTIGWQIGADEDMRRIVASGTAVADPAFGHSVHVDVRGLQPARTYWYRFHVGDWETEIGRTRTAPAPGRMPERLVLGQVSCQRYQAGYWTAFDDLAAHDLDAVLHCGDYIYERGGRGVRTLEFPEAVDLDGYRAVYGGYKADPALRAAHAAAPWVVTWDDHEVENNYQGDVPEAGSNTPGPAAFLARRFAAYQAWWEHQPVRLAPPTGPSWPIHRGIDLGRLVSLSVLDTRQYRSDQACSASDIGARCAGSDDPSFTVMGAEQEAWLRRRLDRSHARWNTLVQQVVMQQWRFVPGDGLWNLDQWDGYPAARAALFTDLQESGAANPVVLTGDVHSSWVGSLATDFDDPDSEVVGTEFVGTSVSSVGDELDALIPLLLAQNPHLRWAQARKRGWTRHEVTPQEWRADHREVDDATVPGSPVAVSTRWVVPDGGVVTEA